MESIPVTLTFLEPYRVVEWYANEDRRSAERYLRGQSFARWHRKKNDKKGRPYITGTLLRFAAIRAAEELLSLSGGVWDGQHCCKGQFLSGGVKPEYMRKRPTYIWAEKEGACSAPDYCPFCIFLGDRDQAGKKAESQNGYPDKSYHIRFGNLSLPDPPPLLDLKEVAVERTLNRVDFQTAKAHDYFKVWEISHEDLGVYTSQIVIHYTGPWQEKVKSLLEGSLRFVDRLCGALCKIEMAPKPARPLPKSLSVDMTEHAKIIVTAFDDAKKAEKVRGLADAMRSMGSKGPTILDKLPAGHDDRDHHTWDVTIVDKTPLRTYLKGVLRADDAASWPALCKALGNALYDVSQG